MRIDTHVHLHAESSGNAADEAARKYFGYTDDRLEPRAIAEYYRSRHSRSFVTVSATEPLARDLLAEQILVLLSRSSKARTADSLRSTFQVRNQRLVETLRQLVEQGKLVRLSQGLAPTSTLPLMMESISPRVAPR